MTLAASGGSKSSTHSVSENWHAHCRFVATPPPDDNATRFRLIHMISGGRKLTLLFKRVIWVLWQ